jgi:hypothetical protein
MTVSPTQASPELHRLAAARAELDEAIRAAVAAGILPRAIRQAVPQVGHGVLKRHRRLLRLVERDGTECVWCGTELGGTMAMTLDHVVPSSQGGTNDIENLVLACSPCNGMRGAAHVDVWPPRCEEHGLAPRLDVIANRLLAAGIVVDAAQL